MAWKRTKMHSQHQTIQIHLFSTPRLSSLKTKEPNIINKIVLAAKTPYSSQVMPIE